MFQPQRSGLNQHSTAGTRQKPAPPQSAGQTPVPRQSASTVAAARIPIIQSYPPVHRMQLHSLAHPICIFCSLCHTACVAAVLIATCSVNPDTSLACPWCYAHHIGTPAPAGPPPREHKTTHEADAGQRNPPTTGSQCPSATHQRQNTPHELSTAQLSPTPRTIGKFHHR